MSSIDSSNDSSNDPPNGPSVPPASLPVGLPRWLGPAAAGLLFVAGCGSVPPAPAPAPAPAVVAPAPSAAPAPAPAAAPAARVPAPAAAPARNWAEYRVQAARRIVQANTSMTYMGVVPEPLLAIPVLEVELNANGSVRHIDVMRYPTQARETVQMAIDAVRRAAPFPSVAHLPKPWKFAEAFLFDDNKRFKPRTLDVR